MSDIDPVQFGQLVSSVQTLTTEVGALRVQVAELKSQLTGGKGIIAGLLLAAGGIGAGASHALDKLFK